MRSRLEPMKKVARMLRTHEPLILNWFRAKGEISNGAVEGHLLGREISALRRSHRGQGPFVSDIRSGLHNSSTIQNYYVRR